MTQLLTCFLLLNEFKVVVSWFEVDYWFALGQWQKWENLLGRVLIWSFPSVTCREWRSWVHWRRPYSAAVWFVALPAFSPSLILVSATRKVATVSPSSLCGDAMPFSKQKQNSTVEFAAFFYSLKILEEIQWFSGSLRNRKESIKILVKFWDVKALK